jgi:hypothetical protein
MNEAELDSDLRGLLTRLRTNLKQGDRVDGVRANAESQVFLIQSIRKLQRTIVKLDSNNGKLTKKITVVAIVLAFVQAISAYPTIINLLTGGGFGLLFLIITVLILIVWIIFIFK